MAALGTIRKNGKTEGKLANLQNLQHLHTHVRVHYNMKK